jgi:peptidoglycan/LPS O-acetylase OafA/YrhL
MTSSPSSLTLQVKPAGYMPQIDSIRGLSALGVAFFHFTMNGKPIYVFAWGLFIVQFFFVLSGFLITGILLRLRAEAEGGIIGGKFQGLGRFYLRRGLRILPLYYAALIGLLAVSYVSSPIKSFRGDFGWFCVYAINFRFLVGEAAFFPLHFWSLVVEEQFYFAWPLLILFTPRRFLPWLISGLIAVGPLFRMMVTLFGWSMESCDALPFACLDSLGMGALLAWLRSPLHGNSGERRTIRLGTIALMAGLPAAVLLMLLHPHVPFVLVHALYILSLSMCFLWLIERASRGFDGWIGRTLEFAPLRYAGRISYGVYVIHPFAILLVEKGLQVSQIQTGPAVRVAMYAASTILAAMVSWHLFEYPLCRLKDRTWILGKK